MMSIFENTEIAFKSKSNKDLKKSYLLFKTLSYPWLVKCSKIATQVALGIHFPIKWAVKPTIYNHFVGGETIEECLPRVSELEKYSVKGILDYSVEGGKTNEDIERALSETLKSIKNAGINKNIPFCVFKPTAFAAAEVLEKASKPEPLSDEIKREAEKFKERVNQLCHEAFLQNIPILIDAEDFAYQSFIDEVVTEMMRTYNKKKAIVFNTLQMYRWDRLNFLTDEYAKALEGNYYLGMKFVRGAYMEKEREKAEKAGYASPIQHDKLSTDRDFDAGIRFSIEHIDRISVFCGTHNEESCQNLIHLMDRHSLSKNDERIYFAQLYGMSDHISFNLASLGYNVAKYIPYGPVKHVLPYLIRRAEENTSVAGQTGRELNLIIQEKQRRKKTVKI